MVLKTIQDIRAKRSHETPSALIDFFNDDFLMISDESHVTVPQVRGMYFGDRSRKKFLLNTDLDYRVHDNEH